MKGMKFISSFAVAGFILSFLFGLFSHTSFTSVLLKALLFGIIFGILGFAINFIFQKFLADDSGDFSNDDTSEDGNAVVRQPSSKGQIVDITIQDEELEKSEGENHFVVGDNHQMLSESDVKGINQSQNDNDKTQGFVPLKNFEKLNDLSGKEAVKPDSVSSDKSIPVVSGSSDDSNIDTLPDMNHMNFATGDVESEEELDTSTDSDFVSSANAHRNSDEVPEIKDAGLMAKAISSILSDENSL